jgi:hypothetical protein
MKAKRQTEVVLNSATMLDGFGGHIWTRAGLQDFANNSASEKDCEHISGLEVRVVTLGP